MPQCVAYGCNNRGGKGSGIHMFGFPKDQSLLKTWIVKIKREKFTPTKHSKLCSSHFAEDAYERNPALLAKYGYENAKPKLREDAVPTIFNFCSQVVTREPLTPLTVQGSIDTNTSTTTGTTTSKRSLFGSDRRKTGGAFAKRQRMELLNEINREYDQAKEVETHIADKENIDESNISPISQPEPESNISPISQPEPQKPKCTRTAKNQTDRKITNPQRTRCTQTPKEIVQKPTSSIQPKTMVSTGIQCELITTPEHMKVDFDGHANFDDTCSNNVDDDVNDPDYELSDSEDEKDISDVSEPLVSSTPESEKKFIVFESALLKLLDVCKTCGKPCTPSIEKKMGTFIFVKSRCVAGHVHEWTNQPVHKQMPWGNFILAASILFSGNSPSKVITLMNHASINCFSVRTFYNIQAAYLIPTVISTWKTSQAELIAQSQGKELTIGGDARCDSPGYSAKYGSYTLLDVKTNKVMDLQLVQCNEVKGSTHMELEGLKRGVTFLEEQGVAVDSLITDRHVQVRKYMRVHNPEKTHMFDVFHVAKGVEKKLEAAAKKKGAEIRPWIKSITNHMYWVAASAEGTGEHHIQRQQEKWMSILNHVSNVHHDHGEIFKECQHDELEEREWIKKGSRPHKLLKEIVESKYLLKDIPMLSPVYQTYGCEVFHSVILMFSPKTTHYSYRGMLARLLLAGLHFNENSNNAQAVTKDGDERWCISYPKMKKGTVAVAKPVKEKATYGYAKNLMEAAVQRRYEFPSYSKANRDAETTLPAAPPPLTHSYDQYDKAALVESRKSRFAK